VEKLMTPEEAAELLRVSVYTLQEYARNGVLPAIKVGRVWRFSERELNAWLEEQHSGPTYDAPAGGHSLARDAGVSRHEADTSHVETAQDRFVRQMIADREAAWRELEEWKKKSKPFDVQALLDEDRKEREEKIDRILGRGKKDEDPDH